MVFAKGMDLGRLVALSQWEKIVLTMAAACLAPLVLHAVPCFAGPELGMRWLPMFYAPLIASLCFRPHVALIAGVAAPLINHALFAMPADRVLPGLMFELVIFNAAVALISARRRVRFWHVVAVFGVVRVLSLATFSGTLEMFAGQLIRSCLMAWPGIVLLAIMAEVVGKFFRRRMP